MLVTKMLMVAIDKKKISSYRKKYCKNSTVKMLIGKLRATLSYTVEFRVKESLFMGKQHFMSFYCTVCMWF